MPSLLLDTPALNAPTIHQLPNGLTIIAEQMPVNAVNFNIWMTVGAAIEPDAISGMAHFLEHMIFKGTPNLPSGEFERRIEERGAATNAATSQEYTHYYITAAPQDFAELAPLQWDTLLNPSIPDEAFNRERLVVLEEIRRSEDNPNRRTHSRAMELCFERLPYRRPVLGSSAVIEQLQAQQMRDFHAQWYRPERMTAAAVGNLPVDELIEVVAAGFDRAVSMQSRLPFTAPQLPTFIPEAPFSEVTRHEYEDDRLQQARLIMVWRVPGMQQLDETYALDVISAILGQGRMSRLFRDLREERQWVTSIGASNMTQGTQGLFYVGARLPVENVEKVEAAIAEHLRSLQEECVVESDLDRICTQVANRFVFGNERPSDRANLYGYYYSQLRNLEPAFEYPARIRTLTPADIREAARRHLTPDAYGIVVARPATAGEIIDNG
ncbi:pitrilysin family protein [Oscillatoria sp. FACHB-1406]|uniref:M16 family metallopeptidase n=1 Tax=Oscillatoria sp. FACHB-1406 TaxID=2692846 RepID=UPI0016836C1C|nr:pitrilysin family protein [Oscillatoria sp. FACHB-1406]MBD2579041.1 insulinase family protein [Oscillatoria sp. FACHB-1406]